MQRHELEKLSREELVAHAERLGIPRPRVLTAPELIDEIISRTEAHPGRRGRERGWLGKARDLLARVVEKGLHLPEAARAIRTQAPMNKDWPNPPPPLATVTLAEIYAAQGHLDRAIAVLDEVLAREPDHKEAKALRARYVEQTQRSKPKPSRVTDIEPAADAAEPGESANTTVLEDPAPPEPEEAAPPANTREFETNTSEIPAAEPGEAAPAIALEEEAAVAAPVEEAAAAAPSTETETATATEPLPQAAPLELEEPADINEVVAIPVDPRTIYVYWEVRAETLAKAKARHEDGSLILRCVSITPTWDGPVHTTRDVPVEELFGDGFLRDMLPGSDIRVTVGYIAKGQFEPFAIGQELALPRVEESQAMGTRTGTYSPAGVVLPDHVDRTPGKAVASFTPYHEPGPGEGRVGGPSWVRGGERRIEAGAARVGGGMGEGGERRSGGVPVSASISTPEGPAMVATERVGEGARGRMRFFSYVQKQGAVAYGGASEQLWGGASDWTYGGASELVRRG